MTTEVNSANFEQEVLASAGPVLVDFYTSNCAPCRMMAPVLNELSLERAGQLKIVKVDAVENPQLTVQFRISAMPTFMLFEQGQVRRQIVGARSKKVFTAWIDGQS
jgi:thioredoxin 1